MTDIGNINCKPEVDPYHRDTGQLTRSCIRLEPGIMIDVYQAYDDHATHSDTWHGITLEYVTPVILDEARVRMYLEQASDLLQQIADGHTVSWDGSNHVGGLTPDARDAWWQLCDDIEDCCLDAEYIIDVNDVLDLIDGRDTPDDYLAVAKEILDEIPESWAVLISAEDIAETWEGLA